MKRFVLQFAFSVCLASGLAAQTAPAHPPLPDAPSAHVSRFGGVPNALPAMGSMPGPRAQYARRADWRANASLPDAPSQRPLSDREKFQIFRRDAVSPLTFLSAGFTAGYNSATDRVYGAGWDGFGKNYALAVAQHETSSFFGNYVFPTLLSQDPRYHPSEKDSFIARGAYAASRIVWTRDDAGRNVPNTSYLLGVLASTVIANYYRPHQYRTAGAMFADFGSTVGGDAGMNLLKEFWPELRVKIRPLTPKRFRKMEDSLVGYTPDTVAER